MQIVVIGCRSLDRVGGIESFMLEMCSCLAKKGHDVKLFVGSDKNCIERKNGFDVVNIKVTNNKYFNKLLIGYKSTKLALKMFPDADIYHYNANVAGLFCRIPLRKNKNVVFMGHGFEWKRAKWNPLIRFFNKCLDNYVLKINRNILMCSKEQVDYVKENFKFKNLMFAPSGVHCPPYMPKNDFYANKKGEYILFLGRVVAEKRLDLLLAAFDNIKGRISQDLYVVGPVENESIISDYRKNARIHFLGSKFGDEKASLLRNAGVYVLPSDLEGLSVALLEAMSYENICLVSDIAANKEALGNAGIYFSAGNLDSLKKNLLSICMNLESFAKYKKLAVERVSQNFEWSIISDRIEKYYLEILENNKTGEK